MVIVRSLSIRYAMLDFGFKAKQPPISSYGKNCYAMLDFGFKAKPGTDDDDCRPRYAMLDFGFKAKQRPKPEH